MVIPVFQEIEKSELMADAVFKLLSAQPGIADYIPATGYISRIFNFKSLWSPPRIKTVTLILSAFSK